MPQTCTARPGQAGASGRGVGTSRPAQGRQLQAVEGRACVPPVVPGVEIGGHTHKGVCAAAVVRTSSAPSRSPWDSCKSVFRNLLFLHLCPHPSPGEPHREPTVSARSLGVFGTGAEER